VVFLKNIKLFFCPAADKELFHFINNFLGIRSGNLALYREAMTHKSAFQKDEGGNLVCNERLEFLGDTILDSIISNYLFALYPLENEGYLTKMRSKIVNRKSLNKLANNLRLGSYLISNNLVVKNNNALGNAFEALVGAIFLDKGYEYTREYIEDKILKRYIDFNFLEKVDTNFKSKLIEIVQRNRSVVTFDTSGEQSDHTGTLVFLSSVIVNGVALCEGEGYSKKEAEQNASRIALEKLDEQPFPQISVN